MTELLWAVSPLNNHTEVMDREQFPQRIKFYDTTLRDGEQTAGVTFTPDEKVMIAELLDEAGVERIEVGMPVVSKQDREAASRIANLGLKAEPWGFARCVKADIDACLDAGLKALVIEISTSPYKMKAYDFTPDIVLDKIITNLLYAKEQGLYTAFFAVDATRSDLDFLKKVYTAAKNEGKADEAVVVDTLGVATPEAMYYLTQKVKEWINLPIMTHSHNDFGVGTACSLASVKGGAEYIHVTVNGLGEKTGNVDLAEAAMASKLYGLDLSIDLKKLRPLAKRVEQLSQIKMSPLKPVVGDNVFIRESGVAVAQLVKYPPAVEGYGPELVGGERKILLSKKSGRASIEWMLEQLQLKANPEQVATILDLVKELGNEKRGNVDESEFRDIVKQVVLP